MHCPILIEAINLITTKRIVAKPYTQDNNYKKNVYISKKTQKI